MQMVKGIHKQIKVTPTNQSKVIAEVALYLLSYYDNQVIRHISYIATTLFTTTVQLNLFESETIKQPTWKTDAL